MKDVEIAAPKSDSITAGRDDLRAAIRPLVRLLARQAANEDYARALEEAGAKSYSTERVRGRKPIEEN